MNLPVFDLHCDTALELLDSQCRPVERLKRRRGHIDLERGGKLPAYAQLFAFFTTPEMDATGRFSPEMIFDAMLSNLQRELQAAALAACITGFSAGLAAALAGFREKRKRIARLRRRVYVDHGVTEGRAD